MWNSIKGVRDVQPTLPFFNFFITKSYLEYELYVFYFIVVNAYIKSVDNLTHVGGLHYE